MASAYHRAQCVWIWLIIFHRLCWIHFVAGRFPVQNRPRIDPEWSEAIERLEIDYDENGRFPAQEVVTKSYSPRNSWDLVGHHEVPYYAILYTNITVEGIPDIFTGEIKYNTFVSTRPGSACGGILVNQRQVLTTCGCLYAWWRWINYNSLTNAEREAFNQEQKIFRFTMHSAYRTYSNLATIDYIPTIYMSHSQVFFEPDFSHYLVNDLSKHTAKWLTCTHWETREKFRSWEMPFGLALADFEPAIQDLDLSSYIPWPPVPIANVTNYNRLRPVAHDSVAKYPNVGIRARVVGMGFQGEGAFTDDVGSTIREEDSMVDAEAEVISLEECKRRFNDFFLMESYVKDYVVCLKGVIQGDGINSVKDGLAGNPVLTGFGSLAGMIVDANSESVQEHYYIMLNFIAGLQYKIENENSGYLLERQKIVRAPLYREGGWEKLFLQYTVPPKYDEEGVYHAPVHDDRSSAPRRLQLNFPTLVIILQSFFFFFFF